MEKEPIRNPMSGRCEECGKTVTWAKDDDPGIQSVDYGMGSYETSVSNVLMSRLSGSVRTFVMNSSHSNLA